MDNSIQFSPEFAMNNINNKSLGKRSTKTVPLNSTAVKLNQTAMRVAKVRTFGDDFITFRNGGLDEMKRRILSLKDYLSDPTRTASQRVVDFYNRAVVDYERAVKSSIGMPSYSDSVTTQSSAPKDVPTLPLDGFQLISRTCYIPKLASGGTTAGGFYATLIGTDLAPFTTNSYFRLKSVTSWTMTSPNSVGTGFAGVAVPVSIASDGTEVMPLWSENWTPVGQGYSGIKTLYPLGDFPQIANTSTTTILTHYTALGGTGGVTGVPVVFHVEIECLI